MSDSQGKKIDKINKVSPSFCLAKWLQVTIDLAHGTNHSCHHPDRHKIPIEDIEKNPSRLHNTNFKKRIRKQMLEGNRPSECEYCWQIEDVPSNKPTDSDRFIKSVDSWAFKHLDKVATLPWDQDINPTYVEIMFDKACNLACGYCIADISSQIEKEIKKYGPFEMIENHRGPRYKKISKSEEDNPYIHAFWNWLPMISEGLDTLRITGGEPLLSKNTFKVIDYFKKNPNLDLNLVINSNLGIKDNILDNLLNSIEPLLKEKKIKKFSIYTSVDAHGKQAEYIRKGLDYKIFISNIRKIKTRFKDIEVVINATYGIYSILTFHKLLEDVYHLKKEFDGVILDTSYLSHPQYLRADMITSDFHPLIKKSLEYMGERKIDTEQGPGFSTYEIDKFTRVYHWIVSKKIADDLNQNRADFYTFITQLDKRYPENFSEAFPEYNLFFKYCKKAFLFVKKLT